MLHDILYRITAPYFCAGIFTNPQGQVIYGAPILKYMSGWSINKVMNYVSYKQWEIEEVKSKRKKKNA